MHQPKESSHHQSPSHLNEPDLFNVKLDSTPPPTSRKISHGSRVLPLDELQMLTSSSLSLLTDEETCRPQLKITCFWVTDHHGDIVSFSEGLIECGHKLYLHGWAKEVTSESSSIESGVPVSLTSPLLEWWFSGFDGSDGIIVGLETDHASYILMEPHPCYSPLVSLVLDQLLLCKLIIETLTFHPETTLPDLYDVISERSNGRFGDDIMSRYSTFLIEQISDYDSAGTDDDIKILNTQALKEFIKLNLTCKPKTQHKPARRDARRLCNSDSLTVTTNLVHQLFSEIFSRTFTCPAVVRERKRLKTEPVTRKSTSIKWSSDVMIIDELLGYKHYSEMTLDCDKYCIGEFICFKPVNKIAHHFGQIKWMFETKNRKKFVHISLLKPGSETILGTTSDPTTLFQVNECQDVECKLIVRKVNVETKPVLIKPLNEDSYQRYYCDKYYYPKKGWFHDIKMEYFSKENCWSCQKPNAVDPILSTDNVLIIDGIEYRSDDFILIDSSSYTETDYLDEILNRKYTNPISDIDEEMFPEYFRKKLSPIKGIYSNCTKICKVVRIENINRCSDEILINIRKLLRPWNVFNTLEKIAECDDNELFWTPDLITIHPNQVIRKCLVGSNKYQSGIEFFLQKSISETNHVLTGFTFPKCNMDIDSKVKRDRLRGLDLFCGAGGLAKGFEDVVETKWAIDRDDLACKSFKSNFPRCCVFNEDANEILDAILKGEKYLKQETMKLPHKGEVDIILAGPPCQGFSNMNRFSSGTSSVFKNSLIATTLGYVDYFRPNYVYIENVRNFTKFNQGLVFKLTLSCLAKMNYQVSFAVLQAGCYGVPQTRKRIFIIAGKSGYQLPRFPNFTTSFQVSEIQGSLTIDGTKFNTDIAMYAISRPLTVYDAISDLPAMGGKETSLNTKSWFQRSLKSKEHVTDHVIRIPSQLNQARISMIPFCAGADWRDLPNKEMQLNDGKVTRKMVYNYYDRATGKKRGVCPCSDGSSICASSSERQDMTLIPWCLSHTAHRNLQWSGLFGRIGWNEYFSTTVTIPEPISKQGRVIHPSEPRVISVREAARSQGFPDDYIICGSIPDKYRQIGNAVPPPLAKALARQLEETLTLFK